VIESELPVSQEVDITTARRMQDFEESPLHAEIKKEDLDVRTLARVNYYVKAAVRNFGLANDTFAHTVDRAVDLEEVIGARVSTANHCSGALRIAYGERVWCSVVWFIQSGTAPAGKQGFMRSLYFRYRYVLSLRLVFVASTASHSDYHVAFSVHVEPHVTRIIAVLAALVSLLFAWGEMVIYHPEASPFAQLMTSLG